MRLKGFRYTPVASIEFYSVLSLNEDVGFVTS